MKKISIVPYIKSAEQMTDLMYRLSWYLAPFKDELSKIFVFVANDNITLLQKPSYLSEETVTSYEAIKDKIVVCKVDNARSYLKYIYQSNFVLCHDMLFLDSAIDGKTVSSVLKENRIDLVNADITSPASTSQLLYMGDKYFHTVDSELDRSQKVLVNAKKRIKKEKGYIFGTGPSVAEHKTLDFTDGESIVCNSIVINKELLEKTKPVAIVLGDPIFHAGPSSYAEELRAAVFDAIDEYKSIVVVPGRDIHIYLKNCPEKYREHFICIPFNSHAAGINYNFDDNFYISTTSNILTLFLLPIAAYLFKSIGILGCDGRPLNESDYYWSHDKSSQLVDKMDVIKLAHPGFFKVDYNEYYIRHCDVLARWLDAIEAGGKSVSSLTKSYIPALYKRRAGFVSNVDKCFPEEIDKAIADRTQPASGTDIRIVPSVKKSTAIVEGQVAKSKEQSLSCRPTKISERLYWARSAFNGETSIPKDRVVAPPVAPEEVWTRSKKLRRILVRVPYLRRMWWAAKAFKGIAVVDNCETKLQLPPKPQAEKIIITEKIKKKKKCFVGHPPVISVIIPVYNCEEFITHTLESLLQQDFDKFECILVDDCSSDNSIKVAKNYVGDDPRFLFLRHNANGQVGGPARNTGVRHASGRYLLFLDADDLLWRETLRRLAEFSKEYEYADYGGVFCSNENISEDHKVLRSVRACKKQPDATFLSGAGNCPFTIHAVLIKKEVFCKLGGFNENYVQAEDWDLWLRMLRHGYSFAHAGFVGTAYRRRTGSQLLTSPMKHFKFGKQVYNSAHEPLDRQKIKAGTPFVYYLPWIEYKGARDTSLRLVNQLAMAGKGRMSDYMSPHLVEAVLFSLPYSLLQDRATDGFYRGNGRASELDNPFVRKKVNIFLHNIFSLEERELPFSPLKVDFFIPHDSKILESYIASGLEYKLVDTTIQTGDVGIRELLGDLGAISYNEISLNTSMLGEIYVGRDAPGAFVAGLENDLKTTPVILDI
eukprot:TRINITY_DN53735_c0_g3_i1.p1 TRINITY_DN53735_c0_g3~~TRINITY_DN53735_c0_g3_i1.p1  ORF type:complete len:992 (-),score=54.89 TRINITY_DN53735_c0_g3_i1:1792-4767(-)